MFHIYENIKLFLKNNKDTNIVFCVANYAVQDMVNNLLISAKKNNVNIVLFALDNEIVKKLEGQCDIVKYIDNGFGEQTDPNKFYKFGTKEFKNVVFQRFLIGNEILNVNKSYIYIDVDIVITNNFVNNVFEQYKSTDYDCLIQFNGDNCCTGFFSMIPNEKTKQIDLNFFKKHNYKKYIHDQAFFNDIIFKNEILNIKFLERCHYPNGGFYYKNYKTIDNECYIIHFNCIIGYSNKINKMKFYKKWYIN
jgi:hypothetical protein